jgi:hypothetical protein
MRQFVKVNGFYLAEDLEEMAAKIAVCGENPHRAIPAWTTE